MKKVLSKASAPSFVSKFMLLLMVLFISPGCQKLDDLFHPHKGHTAQLPGNFNQMNLVANNDEYKAITVDPLLVNAWGLAFSSGGTPWVSNQGSGTSTIYNSEGVIQAISPVTIPSPGGNTGGNPTGVVFNGSNTDFILSNGQAARFIFVGVDGIISGWNGAAGKAALLIKNNSATSAYTGLALAKSADNSFLYAANFRTGKIDVFNRTFERVNNKPFLDPYLPAGYAPFNIQAIGDNLYVTYAKAGPNGEDEKGVGNGYVNVFNINGVLLKRFASRGQLNSPWGVASAPASFFGSDGQNAILIGNFGDGRINAYSWDGEFLGQIRMNGKPLVIDGLWSLSFAPSTSTIDKNRLYFTAGPDDEKDGLFGYLIKK